MVKFFLIGFRWSWKGCFFFFVVTLRKWKGFAKIIDERSFYENILRRKFLQVSPYIPEKLFCIFVSVEKSYLQLLNFGYKSVRGSQRHQKKGKLSEFVNSAEICYNNCNSTLMFLIGASKNFFMWFFLIEWK